MLAKTGDIQIEQCSFACQGAANREYFRLPEFPEKENRVSTRNCCKLEAQDASKNRGCTCAKK